MPARWRGPALAVVLVATQPACSRERPAPASILPKCTPDLTHTCAPEPASASAPALALAPVPAPAGEAHRSTVARLEADVLLLPHLSVLRDHFGASAKGPFDVQRIDLADGRAAVLVSHPDESDPIVLAFDRDQLLWSKPRPVAGILPPVKHLTVLPRPDGGPSSSRG